MLSEPPHDATFDLDDLSTHEAAAPEASLAVDVDPTSDSQFFADLSGDVSRGGLFVATYRRLPVATTIALELTLPDRSRPIRARGRVVWVREHAADLPRGVGVALDGLSSEAYERIRAFCAVRPPLYHDVP